MHQANRIQKSAKLNANTMAGWMDGMNEENGNFSVNFPFPLFLSVYLLSEMCSVFFGEMLRNEITVHSK